MLKDKVPGWSIERCSEDVDVVQLQRYPLTLVQTMNTGVVCQQRHSSSISFDMKRKRCLGEVSVISEVSYVCARNAGVVCQRRHSSSISCGFKKEF